MDAYLFPFFVVLQLLDAGTTYKALKNADLAEGNPVVAWAIKTLGLAGGLLAIKVAVVGFIYFGTQYSGVDPKATLFVLDAIYVAIVVNNIVQLRRRA
jgi:hypothetical protein